MFTVLYEKNKVYLINIDSEIILLWSKYQHIYKIPISINFYVHIFKYPNNYTRFIQSFPIYNHIIQRIRYMSKSNEKMSFWKVIPEIQSNTE